MTLGAISQAILASAALVLHAALLGAAPFAARLAEAAAAWPSRPAAGIAADALQDWRDLLRAGPGVRPPGQGAFADGLLVLVAGAAGAAWLLVPSFATAMSTSRLQDPLVAAPMLLLGLLAGLAMASSEGRSEPVRTLVAGQGALVLLPVALFLACLALGLIAGPGGLDAAVAAAPRADRAALALLIACLALAAMVDLDLFDRLGLATSGGAHVLWRICAAVRLLTWIDLLAVSVPPAIATSALSGPLGWLAALLAWPLKASVLAVLLGLARRRFGRAARARATQAMLGTATLCGLLCCILLLIGAGLE